jgi:hypothetical protein
MNGQCLLCLTVAIVTYHLSASEVVSQESFDAYLKRRLPEVASPPSGVLNESPKWVPEDARAKARNVDKATGLVRPVYPFDKQYSVLPDDDPRTDEYRKALIAFFRDRAKVKQARREYLLRLGELKRGGQLDEDGNYVSSKVANWNGDIFWAPASKVSIDEDAITCTGDQIRAVFGPIPPFDVSMVTPDGPITRADGSTYECRILGLQVDGNAVELKPNTNKPGSPLEFEHTDIGGNHVKWTTTIEKCDKPSLAGGVTPCGTSSRLSVTRKGNVEWIALARKSKGIEPLTADAFWLQEDPRYGLLGYIGFNYATGEVAFLSEAATNPDRYSFELAVPPPGGAGYTDTVGRNQSRTEYGFLGITCAGCHDNKEPRTITPYIKQARVGYTDSSRRASFSLGELLRESTRFEDEPYRVVGELFTSGENAEFIESSQMVYEHEACNRCHTLTATTRVSTATGRTLLTGTSLFAADAVNRLEDFDPSNSALPTPYVGYDESNKISASRTNWATRTGSGKIQPWMVPGRGRGNVLVDGSGQPHPEIAEADWQALKAALKAPPSNAVRVYSQAPAPESIRNDLTQIKDESYAIALTKQVNDNRDSDHAELSKEIIFGWKYHNSFGGVPTRDDVRFHIAIREVEIPDDGSNPEDAAFPTIVQARGMGASSLGNEVFKDGDVVIIKNVSFEGHKKWTDPAPTNGPRDYSVAFPASSGKRYLIRLISKRFTFDQISRNNPGEADSVMYSSYDHTLWVDTN